MANVMRWKRGETNPILCPVAGTAVVEIGDLLVLADSTKMLNSTTAFGGGTPSANYKVYPFSYVASSSQANDEIVASDHFIGVAMQASASGSTDPIRVATDGVFEFPLDAATTTYAMSTIEVYSTAHLAVADQTVKVGTTDPLGRAYSSANGVLGSSVSYVDVRIATKYRPEYA